MRILCLIGDFPYLCIDNNNRISEYATMKNTQKVKVSVIDDQTIPKVVSTLPVGVKSKFLHHLFCVTCYYNKS